jgi:hypothetical protein
VIKFLSIIQSEGIKIYFKADCAVLCVDETEYNIFVIITIVVIVIVIENSYHYQHHHNHQ